MFKLGLLGKLPCFTQSRIYIGRLIEVEKNDNDEPINYLIKTKFSFRSKYGKILSVSSMQIIKITATEIIVSDNCITEAQQELNSVTI